MSKVSRIIRMEFRLTVANRIFIVLTLLGPLLIAAVTILPSLLSKASGAADGRVARIALVGADSAFIRAISPSLEQANIEVNAVEDSTTSLDAKVRSGALAGYLVLPADVNDVGDLEYVSKNATDFRVIGALQASISRVIVAGKLLKAGVSASLVPSLMRSPTLRVRQLTRNGETKATSDFVTVLTTGLMFAMLLYVTLVLYGQVIGRSVLTEKTNKTIEIMLSSVRATDLLFGKILGKAFASLLQYGIWIVVGVVILKVIGPGLGISIGIGLTLSTLAYLVVFFILGFFLYCSLYAALGAMSEDEHHFGQLALPVVIFLIVPVMMISQIIVTPRAPLIVALSLFPLTAPIVMFLRILVDAADPWEILISIGLTIATIAAVIRVSARIFQVGVLMTGKRLKLAEVLRRSGSHAGTVRSR